MVGSILGWLGVVAIYAVIFVGFVDAYGMNLKGVAIVTGIMLCVLGAIWMAFKAAKVLKEMK